MSTLWDQKIPKAYQQLCLATASDSAQIEYLAGDLGWIVRDHRDQAPNLKRWEIVQTDYQIRADWIKWWLSLYDELERDLHGQGHVLIEWLRAGAPMSDGQAESRCAS